MAFHATAPILLLGVCIFLATLILRRGRGHTASTVAVLLLALSALFAAIHLPVRLGWWTEGVFEFYRYGNSFLAPFLTAALLHFALSYPRLSALLDRPLALPLLYLPATLLTLVFIGDIRLYATAVEASPASGGLTLKYGPGVVAFSVITIVPSTLALLHWVRLHEKSSSPVERRILRLLLAGISPLVVFAVTVGLIRALASPPVSSLIPFDENEMGLLAAIPLSYAILRHRILITPVLEAPSDRERRFLATPGTSYIVTETQPAGALEVLGDLASHGAPAVIFTRTPPDAVRERYGLRNTPLYWLGPWPEPRPPAGFDGSVDHTGDLANAARDFFSATSRREVAADLPTASEVRPSSGRADTEGGRAASASCGREIPGGVLLVEDVTPLCLRHGFSAVVEMATTLRKAARRHGGVLLLGLDTRGLGVAQVNLLYGALGLAPDPPGKVE